MNADDGGLRERCSACGFDSLLYNDADTVTTQPVIPAVLEAAIEGLDAATLTMRPNATSWSIAEHLDHVREIAFANRFVIESALADPGVDVGAAPQESFAGEPATVDVDEALAGVRREYKALRGLLDRLTADDWATPAIVDGDAKPIGWWARHVIHDGLHHLADIGRIRHGFGLGAPTGQGHVAQLNVSNGGVPKQPVDSVSVTGRGVEGDAQNDRVHHGRPVQAICLWSAEVISALQNEGHPIAAGNAGENVTVAGIDWSTLMPGSRIDIGPVPVLLTAHAIPCAKNAQWFADGDFTRMLHGRHPGDSRLYGIPLVSGRIAVDDAVVVEP